MTAPSPWPALRELGIAIAAVVPEPNTWRDLLRLLDERSDSIVLKGRTVAVQEYGVPSPELLAGLAERGAEVVPVHTYEWLLPEDTTPLRKAVQALISSQVDVVLVTAAVQVQHLFRSRMRWAFETVWFALSRAWLFAQSARSLPPSCAVRAFR